MCTPLAVLDTCELFTELKRRKPLHNQRLPEAEQRAVNMLVPADVHPRKY